MEVDEDKIDEVALVLLFNNRWGDDPNRAWKEQNWIVLDSLYTKGLIDDPRNKNKSITFTQKGLVEAERCFGKHFGMDNIKNTR